MRHRLLSRIAPPFIISSVSVCIWYISSHHIQQPITISPAAVAYQSTTTPAAAVTSTTPAPTISPLVRKNNGEIRFSIDTKSYKSIHKVEYYVEDTLVGASYTAPYSVSVGEANLKPGNHQVVAVVYSDSITSSSSPTTFTSTMVSSKLNGPTSSVASSPTNSTSTEDDTPAPQPTDPATPPTNPILAPTNVAVVANADNSVTVSWTASDNAVSYQIWRDGAEIGTTNSTAYNDPGLTTGQTYDYSVIAVNGANQPSDSSVQVAATIPTPSETNQTTTDTSTSTNS